MGCRRAIKSVAAERTARPYENLAMAIIEQAIEDARYRVCDDTCRDPRQMIQRLVWRLDARQWLLSRGCRYICEFLGLDYTIIETLAYAGWPSAERAREMKGDFGFAVSRCADEQEQG